MADKALVPDGLDPHAAPPVDRYCDLILTGGVTSGVVYPWAVLELARAYRLKNIGGTSVGAMAAALVAAAEYSRCKGKGLGFEVLRALPGALAENEGSGTKLLSLFQPVNGTKRLFAVFLDMLNRSETSGRFAWVGHLIAALAKAYGLSLAAAAATSVALLLFFHRFLGNPGVLGAALTILLTALLFVALAVYRDVVKNLTENDFGICTGGRVYRSSPPALIEWLNKGIQDTIGERADTNPLTFADLLGDESDDASSHSINLQMVTANLSHGRPYSLPLSDETSRLYFRVEDLRPYFPSYVLRHMVENSKPYRAKDYADPPASEATKDYFELPGLDLPILVAARLSLSFPFLFSAVPLWAIDYEAKAGQRTLQKCWFSDGGICSNFPIHFFDALVPRWPTFGIALGPRSPHWPNEPVWLPEFHNQGRGDSWNRIDRRPTAGAVRLGNFVMAIVDSAKNWSDNTLMRMPAVRDRVVRVGLARNEGDLNLKLTGQQILQLAQTYGTEAGRRLVKKFSPPPSGQGTAVAWDEHRWVRFNLLLAALNECLSDLEARTESTPYAKKISELVADAFIERPLRGQRPAENALSAAQADALDRLRVAVAALDATFRHSKVEQPFVGTPRPSLRIRPRY